MENKYYKLLVHFQRNEKIMRKRLLRINGITEELIDTALEHEYIIVTTPTIDGDIRYMITENGIRKRDEKH